MLFIKHLNSSLVERGKKNVKKREKITEKKNATIDNFFEKKNIYIIKVNYDISGADLGEGSGGGGGGKPSPTSGIRPPADPKGPPFGTF